MSKENPIEFFNLPHQLQADTQQQPKNVLITGVGFEEKPYVSETLNKSKDNFKTMDDKQKSDFVEKEKKTIRWRMNEDGEIESNARIIEWDDGTFQLAIGEDIYDCTPQQIYDTFLYSSSKLSGESVLFPKGEMEQKWQLRYKGKIRELDEKTISVSDK
mmetsp:Transcript_71225/g.82849  ORF Transcript_71225/g.82849 Transcript_71225/m.82849 type:complete len:159 (+) Transcript_71225:31-507(+)|eukprot:CAMPEP_0176447132 /NCGR_PEP_ID=MMETSP0127-20121128/24813_1 /TAXON_ID=938130 /ORGANISM="Platyophrya macrostoma, Strain WH" /LENGTH=158 /DNA_ID=CAMNT_0017833447 /DNA_START=25 /DNA_END=501 /DNA_ORIENTATION=+